MTIKEDQTYIIIEKWVICSYGYGLNAVTAQNKYVFNYNIATNNNYKIKTNEEFIEILIRDITASKGTDPITESQGFIDAILQDNNLQTFLEHIEFLTEADIQYMILKIG